MNLFFLFTLALLAVSTERASSCIKTIGACSDLTIKKIRPGLDAEVFRLPNDDEIAVQGHWGGIKPQYYNLNFSFLSQTHYNGSVTINLRVVETTNKIFLNLASDDLVIEYDKVSLQEQCQDSSSESYHEGCIERITYVGRSQAAVFEFRDFELKPENAYDLVIPSFYPSENRYARLSRAHGLTYHTNDKAGLMTNHFQMRHAQEAFPCFDQMSLKAIFHICIEHPDHLLAASNAILDTSKSGPADQGRVRDCFEPTPLISTYLVTIALMENYTSESIQMPDEDFTLEIFAPKYKINESRAFLDLSIPVIKEMTRITGFKFPMKRMGILMAIGYPTGGMEHLGLFAMDISRSPTKEIEGINTLYHEIIHQWLGDIVTISRWREICLQEGLTTLFEWTLMYRIRGYPLFFLGDKDYFYKYGLSLLSAFETRRSPCYSVAPALFQTMMEITGRDFKLFEAFLAKLIEKRPFGTAGIDLWDETMAELTDGKLKGYIKGWFSIPGPLYLLISSGNKPNEAIVHQRIHTWATFIRKEFVPVPEAVSTPVQIEKIQSSDGSSINITSSIILNEVEQNIPIGPYESFLVDPDERTLSMKLYTTKHYHNLLKNLDHFRKFGLINDKRLEKLLKDFCHGVTEKFFPVPGDKDYKQPEWDEVKSMVKEIGGVNTVHCEPENKPWEKSGKSDN